MVCTRKILPLVLLVALAPGCRPQGPVESGDVEGGGDPSSSEPAELERAAEAEPAASGLPRSDQEVCAVRQAIVAALREHPEAWAAALAERTGVAPCSISDEGARIGQWAPVTCADLGCGEPEVMRFLFREEGNQTPSYAAEVVRTTEGFRCTNLGRFHIISTNLEE